MTITSVWLSTMPPQACPHVQGAGAVQSERPLCYSLPALWVLFRAQRLRVAASPAVTPEVPISLWVSGNRNTRLPGLRGSSVDATSRGGTTLTDGARSLPQPPIGLTHGAARHSIA